MGLPVCYDVCYDVVDALQGCLFDVDVTRRWSREISDRTVQHILL